MSDLISKNAAIEAVGINTWAGQRILKIPLVQPQPSDIAKDIAQIIINEMDMRKLLNSAQHQSNIAEYAYDMGVSLEQAEKELQVKGDKNATK